MGRSAPSLAFEFLARLPQWSLQPDIYTANSLMSSVEWPSALELLSRLKADRLEANAVSYGTCISACGRSAQRDLALRLLRDAVELSVANQVVYNAAINACGGYWEQALALLWERSEPDEISLNSAINACEKGGQWQVALHLLSLASMSTAANLVIGGNSALSAMDKCGQLQPALQLLSQMCRKRLADEISFNCAIAACEKSKAWEKAFQLLQEMNALKLTADEISYRAVMSACPSSEWQKVMALLDVMSDLMVETGEISFNAALNALSTAPAATDQVAVELLQRMAKLEVRPDASSFKAVANCCERGGKALQSLPVFQDLGGVVCERLREIF